MYTDTVLTDKSELGLLKGIGELMIRSNIDWNPLTREIALTPGTDPMWVYATTKTLAEREIWKFAEEHPEVDITTSMFLIRSSEKNSRL